VHRIGPNPYLQYQPNRLNRPEPTGQTAAALTCKPHTAVRTTAAIGCRCFPPSTALATVFPASAHRLSPHPRALTVPIHCCPWGSPRSQPLFCFLTPRSPASALLRAALRLAHMSYQRKRLKHLVRLLLELPSYARLKLPL
jgi:hypothetical protein